MGGRTDPSPLNIFGLKSERLDQLPKVLAQLRKESISENVFIIKIYFYIVFLGSNGTNSSKFMLAQLFLDNEYMF